MQVLSTDSPTLATLDLPPGKRARLHRLLYGHGPGNGTLLVLPLDQGLEHGPTDFFPHPPALDPTYQFRLAEAGGFSAIALGIGLASKYMTPYAGRVPLILKLNGKTNIPGDGEATSPQFASVEDAVRLGADAVGYTLYVGSPRQHDELRQLRQVREDCDRFGMPLVLWAYPRGSAIDARGGKGSLYAQDYAARVALEVGADIVKLHEPDDRREGTPPPYDTLAEDAAARTSRVVRSAGRTIVLFSGGEKNDDDAAVLRKVEFYMESGATGVMFGRNMWLRPFDQAVALTRQVHEIMKRYPRQDRPMSDASHDDAWSGCLCCSPPARAGATVGAAGKNPLETTAVEAGLRLIDFAPRSMLRGDVTRIERPRFPVIDVHTHLTWMRHTRGGVSLGEDMVQFTEAAALLPLMDRMGVRCMVNLTGGVGRGLEDSIARFDRAAPGRFFTMTEPSFHLFGEVDFPQRQADALEQAARAGARGLKLLKTLGLYLREGIDQGALVGVDDPRFDPMWETCAALGLPVFMHTADPMAFFEPTDRHNERYEELAQHPDWSFYGADYPSHDALMAARDRVIARHPRTSFVLLHAGNQGERLDDLAKTLERFPNTSIDISARIGELGRQPRRSRAFIERFADRVMFGTDAVPPPYGDSVPQQRLCDELYRIYYRFLETDDEYFDYAPAAAPPQGRWSIYGLGLSSAILRQVYHDNAARLLGLD